MKTQVLSLDALDTAREIINNGGVVAFPTETVFGLGIGYDSFLGCQKLDEIKSREGLKHYTLMLHDKKDIVHYASLNMKAQKLIDAFMPGPITLILEANKKASNIANYDGTIGIRIPDHHFALKFLDAIERPLYVTSANVSGSKPLTEVSDVFDVFGNKIEAIFNQDAQGDTPSTVVKITADDIEVLREGKITKREIERVINNE